MSVAYVPSKEKSVNKDYKAQKRTCVESVSSIFST